MKLIFRDIVSLFYNRRSLGIPSLEIISSAYFIGKTVVSIVYYIHVFNTSMYGVFPNVNHVYEMIF